MTGEVLLDTSVVVALLQGDAAVQRQMASSRVVLCSIVVGELLYGARRSRNTEANLAQVRAFCAANDVVPITPTTAERFAEVKARLAAIGKPIPDNDLWIGAIAMELGCTLATRDEHFQHVEGLVRVRW